MLGRGFWKKLLAIGAGSGLLWLGLWLLARPAPPPEPRRPVTTVADRAAQHRAYAAWILQLSEVQRPVVELSQSLPDTLGPAMIGAASRVRLEMTVRRIQAALPAVEARLARLEPPEFPALDLPADLTPPAMLRGAREGLRNLASFADALTRLTDAARRVDRRAYERARQAVFQLSRVARAATVTRERAILAGIPRESSDWETFAVRVEYYRAGARLLDGLTRTPLRADRAVAADFLAAADRVDGLVRTGRVKLESEIRRNESDLQRAEGMRRTTVAASLRGALACRLLIRERFDILAGLPAVQRRAAALFRNGGSSAEVATVISQFGRIGDDMALIGRRCDRAMAGR